MLYVRCRDYFYTAFAKAEQLQLLLHKKDKCFKTNLGTLSFNN